jgi:hypothetical protein
MLMNAKRLRRERVPNGGNGLVSANPTTIDARERDDRSGMIQAIEFSGRAMADERNVLVLSHLKSPILLRLLDVRISESDRIRSAG